MNTIADRLALALSKGGLSVAEVIKRGGPSRPTIYRIQNDAAYTPEDYTIVRLADALGVSFEWLANGSGGMNGDDVAERIIPYRVPSIDSQLLTQALDLVLQELLRRKATLPPSKIAAAVVEIYNLMVTQGKTEVQPENVTPFVNLLLAR